MHAGIGKPLGISLAATGLLVIGSGWTMALGDEPGLLGRLFRQGGSQAESPRGPAPGSPPGMAVPDVGAPAPSLATPSPHVPTPSLLPPGVDIPSTPAPVDDGPVQRIRPQPRVSRAATQADPILTRVALGRADDGNQFGMFLQVYADGTVIDGEGVHHLPPEALRPLLQLLQSGELSRASGHCGGPPTDFIEQVYVVVYDRWLGGLRANSFSYSGNTSGCDPAIRHLHQALEQLQARISNPVGVADTATAAPSIEASGAAPPPPLVPSDTASSIPLTPVRR